MGMTVKHTGSSIPTKVWDKKSSAEFAKEAVRQIKSRAFGSGLDTNDRKFKPTKDGKASDLVDTGRLRDSIEVTNVTETTFEVISTAPYAAYVDDKRPFFGLSDGDLKALQDDFEAEVQAAMTRSSKQ